MTMISSNEVEVKYGLPAEVRYCKRCVISNQRPSSTVEFKSSKAEAKQTICFDEEGICSACRFAELKETSIDWKVREGELLELCKRFRSNDGNYDCIVPGSGGKDSAFTSHILKNKYGMNPLTVTWAPHLYTEIGWKNFQSWIHSGHDNILFTPNGKVHRKLTKLAFLNLLHPFQPFIVGQRCIGPKIASQYGVKLVFYGENQAEYGNNIRDNDRPTMRSEFFASADRNALKLSGLTLKELTEEEGISLNELNPYFPAERKVLEDLGVEQHYLGYYLRWDPQECYYYAAEHTGFQANTERTEGSYSKYSSIDDKIDPYHYYTTLIKFGLGRASYDAAQEIRNGKITREEGVQLVKKFDTEFPNKFFKEFLDYLEISEEQFWKTIEEFRSPHLWKQTAGKWELRSPVWEESV